MPTKRTATPAASRAPAVRKAKGLTDPRETRADDSGLALMDHVRVIKAGGSEPPPSRQLPADPFTALYTLEGGAIQPPLDPLRLLSLAETNAIHSACLSAKSADTSGRGWTLEETKKGGDASLPNTLSDQLEAVCPNMSFAELLRQAVWEREAIGWAAWEILRDQGGHIAAIYPIPSHTVRATRDPKVYLQLRGITKCYFKKFGFDQAISRTLGTPAKGTRGQSKLEAEADLASEILWFSSYSARSPYYGVPEWISAIPAMAELTAIREFNVSFFASGGTADRIIHVSAADAKGAQVLADEITATLKEAAGTGHVTIVTHGGSDTSVTATPLNGPQGQAGQRDAQFIRRREDLVKEVLMAHNVPPYRIGWAELGSLGGSAAKEMMRAYLYGGIEPNQTVLEDRLNPTLFGPKGFNLPNYKWTLEDLDWSETQLDLEVATKAVAAALITPNEGRKYIGQNRYEDPAMDRIYVIGGTGATPLTSSVEAATLQAIIGEWKNALEAVMRGEPPKPAVAPTPAADGSPAPSGPETPTATTKPGSPELPAAAAPVAASKNGRSTMKATRETRALTGASA